MALEFLKTPISMEEPGGPDLWGQDDPAYAEYFFDAQGRLPEVDDYVQLTRLESEGAKAIFDPKSVDLKAELAQLDPLMQRVRDVRLVVLRAQWGILAGNLAICVESVAGLADMLEALPDAAHPLIEDGPADRVDAINDLAQMGAMILPLRYLRLAGTDVSLRQGMVTDGRATAHPHETDLTQDALLRDLTREDEAVEATRGQLKVFKTALERIAMACLGHDMPHTPQLKTLEQEVQAVLDLLDAARPDTSPEALAGKAEAEETEATTGTGSGAAPTQPPGEIGSHEEARARLVAVETYFGRYEPSSAAVLLVTQARLLIGKSLIEAFDTLSPNRASEAKMAILSDNGFTLSHPRMSELAQQIEIMPEPEPDPIPQTPTPEPPAPDAAAEDTGGPDTAGRDAPAPQPDVAPPQPKPDMPKPVVIRSASEAADHMLAVEAYFKTMEKSSPVPILLARARGYIGKDFEALLKEFIPKPDY